MFEHIRKARQNEEGFTLIELLMVIVILGILAGVVVFAVGGITDRGQTAACKAEYKTLQVAEEAYYAAPAPSGGNGSYTTSATLLANKFLGSTPKLFEVVGTPGASYTISPASGSACTVAMATS